MEDGETLEECLQRELYEEFGIKVIVKNYFCNSIYTYPHTKIELLAFFCRMGIGN
ncbi:MAG: NUDIX domain-containing protein [Syntrophales bacterium]|nr:NUDIX domain-containing protein [Syntrophales bacterium]